MRLIAERVLQYGALRCAGGWLEHTVVGQAIPSLPDAMHAVQEGLPQGLQLGLRHGLQLGLDAVGTGFEATVAAAQGAMGAMRTHGEPRAPKKYKQFAFMQGELADKVKRHPIGLAKHTESIGRMPYLANTCATGITCK